MANKCSECNLGFANNAYRVACGSCASVSHTKCVNLTKEDYLFLKKDDKSWYCESCAKKRRLSRVVGDGPAQSPGSSSAGKAAKAGAGDSGDDIHNPYLSLLEIMEEIRSEVRRSNASVRKEIEEFKVEVKDMTDNLNRYSDRLEDNITAIDTLKRSVDCLSTKIEDLKDQSNITSKELGEMKIRFNEVEQQMKENTLEIVGVPFEKTENVLELVKTIGQAVDFEVAEQMVSDCFRTRGNPASKLPGIIVVDFVRKLDKKAFYAAAKSANLTVRALGILTGEPSKIYVNNSLTYANRKLLSAAKQFKIDYGFRFAWASNGRIMLKKSEIRSDPAIVIRSSEQLRELSGRFSQQKSGNAAAATNASARPHE
ncbi:DM3 [Nesidiocoris tenuis]|uniref:DM3 n=1 Tax=Nesidiocoris tenuis TaxID=355587 RepID=A0ABN7B705_9HEMI|nr:DM3 [Nesidiocoris tenuis]